MVAGTGDTHFFSYFSRPSLFMSTYIEKSQNWHPFGFLLAPFGSLLVPFGFLLASFWRPLACFWCNFWSPLDSIFSLLESPGVIFHVWSYFLWRPHIKPCFWANDHWKLCVLNCNHMVWDSAILCLFNEFFKSNATQQKNTTYILMRPYCNVKLFPTSLARPNCSEKFMLPSAKIFDLEILLAPSGIPNNSWWIPLAPSGIPDDFRYHPIGAQKRPNLFEIPICLFFGIWKFSRREGERVHSPDRGAFLHTFELGHFLDQHAQGLNV